ncbi:DUF58 domain-containing protein [Shimia thalassica]|uniref:DUF58 domain-containing protein n=1 Tax=Shimia thalassica TaxID=1715693 RepID=UPI0027328DB6|nr:DUF58 domain-containing protein [Shimia thalassica]MDP2494577.1 DUF58 domain-containing protein [Shimia thalassica]
MTVGDHTKSDDPRIRVDLAHLRGFERHARSISFLPKQPARSALNGRHASRLRGRGLNFEELRNYQHGDDIRTIDWKVTARTGEPYVRVYTEERDRPALLLVDQRMSMFFGTSRNMKSVTAAEAAALASWRLRLQGDRVGGLIFGDARVAELPPRASGVALNRFLSVLADANGLLDSGLEVPEPMSLNQQLEAAVRIAKTGMMILIFSDFHGVDARSDKLIRRLTQHNDVLAFPITDPAGRDLPDEFRLIASDGRLQVDLDTAKEDTRVQIADLFDKRIGRVLDWSRKYGVPVLPLTSAEETLPQMLSLFGARGRG